MKSNGAIFLALRYNRVEWAAERNGKTLALGVELSVELALQAAEAALAEGRGS